MPSERSLILFKPDAVERRLCGKLLSRIEDKGLIYQQHVAEGYRAFAERYHEAVLIDGSQSPDVVADAVWKEVTHRAR